MFSCDYNGWADVPEEEREGIDLFETAQAVPAPSMLVWCFEGLLLPISREPPAPGGIGWRQNGSVYLWS